MKTNLKAFLLAASFTLLPMLAFGQGALGLGVVGSIAGGVLANTTGIAWLGLLPLAAALAAQGYLAGGGCGGGCECEEGTACGEEGCGCAQE